jgi:predicted O-methyltransferase YrrM
MESLDKVKEKWNAYSSAYSVEAEPVTLQAAVTLYNIASCNKADRILDAGCGPGLAAQALSTTYMKDGSRLYCLDIAEKMIDILHARFTTNDFSKNPENAYKCLKEVDVSSLDKIEILEAETNQSKTGKTVFSILSDTEVLPFPS